MSTVVVGILITLRMAMEVKEDPDLRLEAKRFESRILIWILSPNSHRL